MGFQCTGSCQGSAWPACKRLDPPLRHSSAHMEVRGGMDIAAACTLVGTASRRPRVEGGGARSVCQGVGPKPGALPLSQNLIEAESRRLTSAPFEKKGCGARKTGTGNNTSTATVRTIEELRIECECDPTGPRSRTRTRGPAEPGTADTRPHASGT